MCWQAGLSVAAATEKTVLRVDALELVAEYTIGTARGVDEVKKRMQSRDFVMHHGSTECVQLVQMASDELRCRLREQLSCTPKCTMTDFGRSFNSWHLQHTLCLDTARTCNKAELSLIQSLSGELARGDVSLTDIRLAVSTLTGEVRNDKIAMGILECSLNNATHPHGFKGRMKTFSSVQRDRLQAVSMALASTKAPETCRKAFGAMKFTVCKLRAHRVIPSGLGSIGYRERLLRIALSIKDTSNNNRLCLFWQLPRFRFPPWPFGNLENFDFVWSIAILGISPDCEVRPIGKSVKLGIAQ